MTRRSWQLILDGPNVAAYNMAVDEVLLKDAAADQTSEFTCLRFYQWARPALSLGFSQKAARVIDFSFCRERGIELVRRLTGGKAVLHHHELTYSVVSNDVHSFPLSDIGETYRRIAQALVLGFRHLGIETYLAGDGESKNQMPRSAATSACFAVSNHHEILWSGRKLVGSAQRRAQTAFLQHGSILLDFDPELLAGALGNRNPSGLGLKVASLAECLGWRPDPIEVASNLQRGFEKSFGVDLKRTWLNARQRQLAEELASQKYAQLDWSHLNHARVAAESFELGDLETDLWLAERRFSDSPKLA